MSCSLPVNVWALSLGTGLISDVIQPALPVNKPHSDPQGDVGFLRSRGSVPALVPVVFVDLDQGPTPSANRRTLLVQPMPAPRTHRHTWTKGPRSGFRCMYFQRMTPSRFADSQTHSRARRSSSLQVSMYSRGLHATFLHNYDVYRFVLDLDNDIVLTQARLLYILGPSSSWNSFQCISKHCFVRPRLVLFFARAPPAGEVFLVVGCYSSRDIARKEYEAKLLKYRSGELVRQPREPSGRVGLGTKICKAIRQAGRAISDPRLLVFGIGRGDLNNSFLIAYANFAQNFRTSALVKVSGVSIVYPNSGGRGPGAPCHTRLKFQVHRLALRGQGRAHGDIPSPVCGESRAASFGGSLSARSSCCYGLRGGADRSIGRCLAHVANYRL